MNNGSYLTQGNSQGGGGYNQPPIGYPPQVGYNQPQTSNPPQQPPLGGGDFFHSPPGISSTVDAIHQTWETYGKDIDQSILDQDCQRLRDAMKGSGTDERAIIAVLTSRCNVHRYLLKQRYKVLFDRDLVKDLKKELSSSFEDCCLALVESPYELDCRSLYEAMHGLGTNESTLIEIILTRPTHQLYQDKILFQKLYKKDLIKYVESETSGLLRKILVGVLQCQRHENDYPINNDELQMEAQKLYSTGVEKWKKDDSIFTQLFSTRSPNEIAVIAQFYKQLAGFDIEISLQKGFKGDILEYLRDMFNSSTNITEWFAKRIRNCVDREAIKIKRLIRTFIFRAEVDLKEINDIYIKLYGNDMFYNILSRTRFETNSLFVQICQNMKTLYNV